MGSIRRLRHEQGLPFGGSMLAQFAREPTSKDYKVAAERSYSLRDAINNNFDNVRASADGVLFEFGPSRQQDLAWRSKFRQWQPQLRLLFIAEIALWKYRAGLPGFELPQAVGAAQRAFDDEPGRALEAIADQMEGRPIAVRPLRRVAYVPGTRGLTRARNHNERPRADSKRSFICTVESKA
jgi:hypothetical protein